MKRQLFLLILLAGLVTSPVAQAQDTTQTPVGQRQGGRGAGVGQRQGAPPNTTRALQIQTLPVMTVTNPWWNNNALVTRLGLTDLQKSRIEGIFEAHRQGLVSTKDQLEKEEAQLSKLLEAESIDRNGIFTQINRVIQARGEMERANSTMTLEMREQLTRAQWAQLQAAQPTLPNIIQHFVEPGGLGPGEQPAGARGGRGGGLGRGTAPPQQ